MEAAVLLYADACSILDGNLVALCDAVSSMESKESYGTILFDHLAADGAGFTGGQVTVVAVGQVDTDFGSGLHLETVHCLAGLGNVQLFLLLLLIIVLSFAFFGRKPFPKKAFSFRRHSLTKVENSMNVK